MTDNLVHVNKLVYEKICERLSKLCFNYTDESIIPQKSEYSFSIIYTRKPHINHRTVIKCAIIHRIVKNNQTENIPEIAVVGFSEAISIEPESLLEDKAYKDKLTFVRSTFSKGITFKCFDISNLDENDIIDFVTTYINLLSNAVVTNIYASDKLVENAVKDSNEEAQADSDIDPVDTVILSAFKALQSIQSSIGLVRPIYSPLVKKGNGADYRQRFSEQELKQKFIEELSTVINDRQNGWAYSVETPSIDGYTFKRSEFPTINHHALRCDNDEDFGGLSARFDCTVYSQYIPQNDAYDILSHIEFKHGNGNDKEITKDLLKLSNEPLCPDLSEDERRCISNNYIGNLKNKTHYLIHLINGLSKKIQKSLTCKYFGLNENLSRFERSDYTQIANCLKSTGNHIYIWVLVQNNKIGRTTSPFACFRIDYNKTLDMLIQNNTISLDDVWQELEV